MVAPVTGQAETNLSVFVLCGTLVWLPEKCASFSPWFIFTYSRKHFQDSGMAKHRVLKEWVGSSLLVKGSLLQY